MIFVKLRRNNPLTILWVFSPNQTILKRVRAAFQLKEKNSFLLVLIGRGKAQLKLLLTKKGVGHYWRRNQKLPTMGSKTVDREEEKSPDGSKKTGETGPKNWRQMSRAGPKKRVKRRSEQRVDGFVDWGYNLCVFHRSVWQHSFCKERIKCTPIRVMNQDSILHAKGRTAKWWKWKGTLHWSHQIILNMKLLNVCVALALYQGSVKIRMSHTSVCERVEFHIELHFNLKHRAI